MAADRRGFRPRPPLDRQKGEWRVKQQYADSIAAVLRPLAPDRKLFEPDVALIDQLATGWDARRPHADPVKPAPALPVASIDTIPLTARTAAELVGHEAIVQIGRAHV